MTTNYFDNGGAVVTTTLTLVGIFPAESGDTIIPPGTHIVLKNSGPEVVYLGDNELTADASLSDGGFPLAPGEIINLPAPPGDTTWELYGLTAAGTACVNYIFLGAVY